MFDIIADDGLRMFILQCRADRFIRLFESNRRKYQPSAYELYLTAYANYVLLSDDNWTSKLGPVLESARKGCREILDYLAQQVGAPMDVEDRLKAYLPRFVSDDDMELWLDGNVPALVAKGYDELDCRLAEAVIKMDFREAERLLEAGANPKAKLTAEMTPAEAEDEADEADEEDEDADFGDAFELSVFVDSRVCDAFDCDGLGRFWKSGADGETCSLSYQDIETLFYAAGYQLMLNLINRFSSR